MFNNRRDGRRPYAGGYGGRGCGQFVTPSSDAAGASGSWSNRLHPDWPEVCRRRVARRVGERWLVQQQ
jgi:hypothetical protein